MQDIFFLHNRRSHARRVDLMAAWLIAIIGVVYAVVAADLLRVGHTGLGIAFVGYSIGNVGLYLAARG